MIIKPHIKIRRIRELKNLTQDFVAQQLGLSTRAYSKIETGETQLTIFRLNDISEILGVDPIEILGFDGDKMLINNSIENDGLKNINFTRALMNQYEETIQSLKEQIDLLKTILKK